LSIKPVYAEAIFAGKKRFEFRRSIFRENIRVVVVYMSSPVMQVVGEFSVEGIITDDVADLWDRTERHAGIDRKPSWTTSVARTRATRSRSGTYDATRSHATWSKLTASSHRNHSCTSKKEGSRCGFDRGFPVTSLQGPRQ
jgi:hypothetical protein